LVQVLDRDASIRRPLYQVLAELLREVGQLFQPGHLPTEYHLSEFVSEPLSLLRIVCGSKTFGEFKKGLFLLFLRFEAVFEELNKHAVGTQATALRHVAHLSRDFCRKRNTLTDSLFFDCHNTIMHQSGAIFGKSCETALIPLDAGRRSQATTAFKDSRQRIEPTPVAGWPLVGL
jgi:hypothetical protein